MVQTKSEQLFESGKTKYKLNDYVTKETKEFSSIFIYSNYHY